MSQRADLRREFDESFARAPIEAEAHEAMLRIAVHGRPYVVSLSEIQNVTRAGLVTPAPSARRELVGISAVRGRITAVFDLATLLGHPRAATAAWLLHLRAQGVAMAVESVEG